MLWQTLWHLPYDEILILEDDALLCENFQERFLEFKSQLPDDWQYVFVGHCCLPPEDCQIKISDNIITTTHPPMCTHAYMIKKSSIPVLLDTNHQAWAAVDIQIQKKTLKILKHYVFMPPLVEQISLLQQRNPDKYDTNDTIFESLTLDSKYI
jgi:GR25 family glycosyltransferase involved in LPS biosynthesis